MPGPFEAKEGNWDEIVRDGPVVVDFWAPWCGWCQRLAPGFDRLASEFSGRITFVKVNVDEEQLLATRLGIQTLPTLTFLCGGRVVEKFAGFLPEAALRRRIDQVLREHATCQVPVPNRDN